MSKYLIQVTYQYVDTYEVESKDVGWAKLAYEAGRAEHVSTTPPTQRAIRIIPKED